MYIVLPFLLLIAPEVLAKEKFIKDINTDINVSTDLDERYIVKASTVSSAKYSRHQIIAFLLSRLNECSTAKELCMMAFSQDEKAINSNSFQDLLFLVRFRPIFVDLNSHKTALKYMTVACARPRLAVDTQKVLSKFVQDYAIPTDEESRPSFPQIDSKKAVEVLKRKVCEKYAKF